MGKESKLRAIRKIAHASNNPAAVVRAADLPERTARRILDPDSHRPHAIRITPCPPQGRTPAQLAKGRG